MFMLGKFTPGKKNGLRSLYESGMNDIALYKGTTRWAQKGSKVLGFEKPPSKTVEYTTDEINTQYKKKLKEIEQSDLSNAEKTKKIKELQRAARDMHFGNELKIVNEAIENELISREEFKKLRKHYYLNKMMQQQEIVLFLEHLQFWQPLEFVKVLKISA